MLTRRILLAGVFLVAASTATAQTGPQLLTVFPVGAKAGSTVEVTVSGHSLDGAEKLLFSAQGFQTQSVGTPATLKAQQGQPTASQKFQVTIPSDVRGTVDVRLVTKTGLSNPRAFVVSDHTDVNEAEPNNDVGQAQKIELETTVNGVISTPTDVDFVTFKAKAGQTIVVSCLTTSLDSRLQADVAVMTLAGKPVAANRGYRDGDALLEFQAPETGDYLVRLAQFAYTTGGFDHFYRLTVSSKPPTTVVFPPLADPQARLVASWPLAPTAAMADLREPADGSAGHPLLLRANPVVLDNDQNHTADTAQAVQLPCDIAGRITTKGERDWYKFTAKKGEVWTLEVFAERIGSPVDAFFILTDDKGTRIVEQDDSPDTLSPNQFYTKGEDPARYKFTVPADGTYKVMVSTREAAVQYGVRNQYVLRIAKEKPDFRIAVMPYTPHLLDAGTLAKGSGAVFAVFVFRFDGFNDAIELTATGLPPGVTCPPQVIGPGQTRGTLVLMADKTAADWEGFVKIIARSGDWQSPARSFSLIWPAVGVQPNQPPPNSPMLTRMDRGDGLALAVRGNSPFALIPTPTKLTAKAGGKFDVTLQVTRDDKFKEAIAIFSATPHFATTGKGNNQPVALGTVAAGATEIKLSIDVPNSLTPGTHTLVLRGQSATPPPKGGGGAPVRLPPTYAASPILVTVEGTPPPKKK